MKAKGPAPSEYPQEGVIPASCVIATHECSFTALEKFIALEQENKPVSRARF